MAEYYSLEEVTKLLGKNEAEIRNLVHDGKLREFYDGGTKMFKTDEVDSLKDDLEPLSIDLDLDGTDSKGTAINLGDDSAVGGPDESSIIGLTPLDDAAEIKNDDSAEEFQIDDSVNLDNEMSSMIELSEADTNFGVAAEGINILDGSNDSEFGVLNDSMGDTNNSTDLDGTGANELSGGDDIGRLDADVNLDSFGSGSGLLDLSLQADDTSLGAVLDDILPNAGGDEVGGGIIDEFAMDEDENAEPTLKNTGSSAGDSDLVTNDSGFDGLDNSADDSVSINAAPTAQATVAAVVAQDPASSAYGSVLFIPLVALLIVGLSVFAAVRGITPSFVKLLIGYNLYITIALAVVTILLAVVAVAMGSPKKAKAKKVAQPKKEKKTKKKKKK